MSTSILLDNVSLKFRVDQRPTHSLKEWMLTLLSKQRRRESIHEFYALKNINLEISAGDRLGVIGLNGAGKSTLLKAIAGIYPPESGKISITGRVNPLIEIGVGFDQELTGRQNIYINGALLGLRPAEIRKLEDKIISFAELEEFADLPVKYYSAGMYGRLTFSISTMIEPEILLVDEVFAAGDAHFVDKASKRMLGLFTASKIVVFVSHALDQISNLCNRAIVVHQGRVAFEGNADDTVNYYLSNIVALTGSNGE